jgi:hypothetical protein
MTDILALDVATSTGFARGKIGEAPVCSSIKFGTDDGDVVFAAAMTWLNEYLAGCGVPDMMIIEALLPPDAMKNETSRQVRDRLAGLHGVVRAVAHKHGVVRIAQAAVGDVRAHFISASKLKRKQAKAAVMAQCKALGWAVADDNAGDAAALWSYGCAIVDPANALTVVPLFNPKLRVTVWP